MHVHTDTYIQIHTHTYTDHYTNIHTYTYNTHTHLPTYTNIHTYIYLQYLPTYTNIHTPMHEKGWEDTDIPCMPTEIRVYGRTDIAQ